MNALIFSFNVVAPVFLVIAVGYLLKQVKLINDDFVNNIIKFNFRVGLSALLFKNVYTSNLTEEFNLKLVVFSIVSIVCIIIVFSFLIPVFIKDKKKASAIIHTVYRSNFVLLGIPLAINMFGESHTSPVALLLSIVIPAYNFFAVVLLLAFDESNTENYKAKLKSTFVNTFKNPLILGSLAAIILQLLSFKLPTFLEKAVFDIASLGTPLALITLGAQFDFKKAQENLKYSLLASFCRLILVPFIVIALGVFVGFRGYDLGAIFILFSSPAAVTCYVMAKEMNSDYELTGDIILLTTLFSIFTLFLGIYILRTAGLL